MQLHFNSVSEPSLPGIKWKKLFNTYWPAYAEWLNSKVTANTPDLKTSVAALKYYMPEMVPTYERLCKLVNADDLAARFLTGYQPPAYISACSQAVTLKSTIQLVRNYDYHPDLIEGTLLMSAWNGKKVIANSDCLSGVIDGMNEDGLAVSLTFGGRKEVGTGFGIPFILRYVLEFCSNVEEAVVVLTRIPSHMSYNVTVIDKTGAIKTVQMAPDKSPLVTDALYTTNHQGTIDWPENALFNKTVERSDFLKDSLFELDMNGEQIADAFLRPPLYSHRFTEGFGTLFTAVYQPVEGTVKLRWLNDSMLQSFDDFKEQDKLIKYQSNPSTTKVTPVQEAVMAYKASNQEVDYSTDTQEELADTLINGMAMSASTEGKERLKTLRKKLLHRGQISWEILADYWANLGNEYWKKWQK